MACCSFLEYSVVTAMNATEPYTTEPLNSIYLLKYLLRKYNTSLLKAL